MKKIFRHFVLLLSVLTLNFINCYSISGNSSNDNLVSFIKTETPNIVLKNLGVFDYTKLTYTITSQTPDTIVLEGILYPGTELNSNILQSKITYDKDKPILSIIYIDNKNELNNFNCEIPIDIFKRIEKNSVYQSDYIKNQLLSQHNILNKVEGKIIKRVQNTFSDAIAKAEELSQTDDIIDNFYPSTDIVYDNNNKEIGYQDLLSIIPSYFFENSITYTFIGKEYGFYIDNTVVDKLNSYFSSGTFLIFDIDTHLPYDSLDIDKTNFMINIYDIDTYDYKYYKQSSFQQKDMWDNNFSSQVSSVPILTSKRDDIFIRNLSFMLNISNAYTPNIGDDNYNIDQDKSDFITRVTFNYGASGPKTYNNNSDIVDTAFDTIMFIAGFVPQFQLVSLAYDLVTTTYDLITTVSNEVKNNQEETRIKIIQDNRNNTFDYGDRASSQKNKYGNLIKTSFIYPQENSDFPILFGDGDYANATFETTGMEENTSALSSKINIQFGISLDICCDKSTQNKILIENLGHSNKINDYGTFQTVNKVINKRDNFKNTYSEELKPGEIMFLTINTEDLLESYYNFQIEGLNIEFDCKRYRKNKNMNYEIKKDSFYFNNYSTENEKLSFDHYLSGVIPYCIRIKNCNSTSQLVTFNLSYILDVDSSYLFQKEFNLTRMNFNLPEDNYYFAFHLITNPEAGMASPRPATGITFDIKSSSYSKFYLYNNNLNFICSETIDTYNVEHEINFDKVEYAYYGVLEHLLGTTCSGFISTNVQYKGGSIINPPIISPVDPPIIPPIIVNPSIGKQ